MSSRLIIPEEGELSYQPAFISPELALEASSDIMSNPNIGGIKHFSTHTKGMESFMLTNVAPPGFEQQLRGELVQNSHNARMRIYEQLFNFVDFDWRQIIGYARVMSQASGNNRLGIHTDGARDIRVMANAGGNVNWFFSGRYKSKYPNGIPIFPGDVITINNLCHPDDQVEHGVELTSDTRIRVGFLFHVYEQVAQKVSTRD